MSGTITRRDLIALLGSAVIPSPAAIAQNASRTYRVGLLNTGARAKVSG
jgi:hypothetical protein